MGRNIEIKARSKDFYLQSNTAGELSDGPSKQISQVDTFFQVPRGRLKLREFGDGTGELIQYDRPDASGPTSSSYIRSHTSDPDTLKDALATSLGIRAVVKKERTLYLAGQTRIHLDEVFGLGRFIELEVVLEPDQAESEGTVIAEEMMSRLGIRPTDLISESYVDLLTKDYQ